MDFIDELQSLQFVQAMDLDNASANRFKLSDDAEAKLPRRWTRRSSLRRQNGVKQLGRDCRVVEGPV